jgi:hypothetical protein
MLRRLLLSLTLVLAGCHREKALPEAEPADLALLQGGPTVTWAEHHLTWQVPPGWSCGTGDKVYGCAEGPLPTPVTADLHADMRPTLVVQVAPLQGSLEEALRADRAVNPEHNWVESFTVAGMPGTLSGDTIEDKTPGFHCLEWNGYRAQPAEGVRLSSCALTRQAFNKKVPVLKAIMASLR